MLIEKFRAWLFNWLCGEAIAKLNEQSKEYYNRAINYRQETEQETRVVQQEFRDQMRSAANCHNEHMLLLAKIAAAIEARK